MRTAKNTKQSVHRGSKTRENERTMARDDKGHFLPGNKEGHRFKSNGDASVSGAKGVAVREERKKERQTLADVLRKQLEEKAADGSELTKLEYLVARTLQNHSKGTLSLKDLTYLQKLLGEDTLNINTNGPQIIVVSAAAVKSANKWAKKKEE